MASPKEPERKEYGVFGVYQQETKRFPWLFLGAVLGTIGLQVTDLIAPLYLKQFFNALVTHTPSGAVEQQLLGIIIAIAVVYILGWVAARVELFSITNIELKVMANLYTRAFDYLIRHSHHFFSSEFSGTLTRRVTKFADAYEGLFDSIMLQFFPTTLFVIGAVAILFTRNHVLGTALGIWAVLFILFQIGVAKLRQPLRDERAAENSRMVGTLSDAVTNQNAIMLFSRYRFEGARFKDAVTKWHRIAHKTWVIDDYIWAVTAFFVIAIEIALLYGSLYFWERGKITIGDFVLIQAYLITAIQQLVAINRNLRRFFDSYADASEMIGIFNTPYDVSDRSQAKEIAVTNAAIDFEDVSFHFSEDRPILKNFTLHIQAGERIALVGPSGAGKSTITRLLLRFYDATGGTISIDKQPIASVTQESLREAVGFVPQEPVLFHRTLRENIAYGKPDATDEEVIEAARKAHCHDFISSLPEGYNTFVGERGVKLSGGERQRVAIARAILKNAPILVLDEATSSLDSESESLIQDALKTLMEGKTVIVIAHRLSTIMSMDRIVVLEGGKIAAEGTHDELVRHEGGLYHKLWSIQAGGFVVDTEDTEE